MMATGSAGHSDQYLVYNSKTQESRPLNIDEKERLMGWEVGSTAEGIDDAGNTISMQLRDRERLLGDRCVWFYCLGHNHVDCDAWDRPLALSFAD